MPSFNWIPSPKRRLTSSTSGASDRSRSPSDAVYPTPTPAALKESTNASDERPAKKSRWSPRKLSKPAKRKGLLALEAAKIMDTHLAEADGLRDELVRTRTEIDAERRHSQEERERDRARIVGLERTLVAQAREMQDVKTRAAQTQQRSDSGEAVKALVKALQDENALWGKELELSRTRARELEEKLLRQTRALEHLRKELAHTKAEQARTDELLKTRTWELQGAESFLTKADAISGAEVIAVVEGLNVEIFQAAAHMADSFSPEFEADENPAVGATPEEVKTQRKLVLDTFGEPLVHFLQNTKHNEDPIVIQVAFQAAMSICAQTLVQNWYPFDARINTLLSSIHESAQKTELQSISGRWRALTRTHIRASYTGPSISSTAVPYIARALLAILITAGHRDTHAHLAAALESRFGEALKRIAQVALRLRKAIGEDITSGDIAAFCVPGGAIFDPTKMEDGHGDGPGHGGETSRVLCATHLGLRRAERVSRGGERIVEERVILKPKVALQSLLDE